MSVREPGSLLQKQCPRLRVVYARQVPFLGELGLPRCAAARLARGFPAAAAARCERGSGVAERLERDLCYLQAHAVQ